MSRYDDRTLALLGAEGEHAPTAALKLTAWAAKNAVALPAAYLEWAELDPGGRLLAKYSNQDDFCIDEPRLEATPDGGRGLLFWEENQGNCHWIAALDHGDDPPVFVVFDSKDWAVFADRFSDCVYAQIFDWQYRLELGGPYGPEITYYGHLKLKTERCLDTLRHLFTPCVVTQASKGLVQYRFQKSLTERLTVTVGGRRPQIGIEITGDDKEQIRHLEAELGQLFAADMLKEED